MRGWILDLYPGAPGEMVVWLKDERGEAVRLVDHWSPSIYIATDERADLSIPLKIVGDELAWTRVVQKQERITDQAKSEVVEARVKDARRLQQVAGRIEKLGAFGTYRLYNVDVQPNQSYLYEKDLFPLAYCEVRQSGDRLEWDLQDDVMECDYRLPDLKTVGVDVAIDKQGRMPKDTDRIKEIRLKNGAVEQVIDCASEADDILELVRTVKRLDSDFVTTGDGDTFLFPYLIKRAEANGVSDQLSLDRDGTVLKLPTKKGTSFFSYGKIHYKPSAIKLCGRVHIDTSTSFSYSEAGFHGLFELSRICRMPLQTASRASIGKALSSLQFYQAFKMDLLIPWKPTLAEHFKDRAELLVADRGGFIFEPKAGLHEDVAELDFSSLYPTIMLRKNISAETVRCPCCPDSKNRVPELDWNVCEKRTGLVAKSMKIIVDKRLRYKELKKGAKDVDYDRYDQCQAALKWIGVTCLPRDSYVLIREGGRNRCTKIGDFIDSIVGDRIGAIERPPEVFVSGIGPDLKSRYCRISRLIKQKNERKLLRIRMEDGRQVDVTHDHPFFTLHDSELNVKVADELNVGELIPVAKRMPASPDTNTVNLIESLKEKLSPTQQLLWRVGGTAVKEAVAVNRRMLLERAMSDGYSAATVKGWERSGIIPLKFFYLLDIESPQHGSLRIGSGRREGGRIAWIPVVLQVNEALGFFLGLYVADGSAGRNFIRLDIGLAEPDLLENARHVVKELFNIVIHVYRERNARMFVVQINNATLVQVLEQIFGLPGSAERGKLKVPEILFNAAEDAVHGFIEGMIAGDGYASKKRQFINIASKSEDLVCQLGFLAARAGLTFRIARHRIRPFPLYTLNFVGPETLRKVSSWQYLKDAHRKTMASWANGCGPSCSHPTYDRLPVEESGLYALARATRTSSEPHAKRGSEMCPVSASEKVGRIRTRKLGEKQVALVEKLGGLLTCDIGFVRVVNITELDSKPEYVYCFQLDQNEVPGFFTGEGLVYVHNCFGYLGFNNAKFGRIDAHIAVCAWDRKVLVDAARVAERRGFEVIHGIVDSLWLKKEGAEEADYLELKSEIERETGFVLSFEGMYKWIAFPPSKVTPSLPVQNRYFGVYREGGLKVRGIEARRHDTPLFLKRCQMEVLNVLAGADSVAEAKKKVPECVGVFLKYARAIKKREATAEEMALSVNLSKKPEEYVSNTLQSSVAKQLALEGADLHAGKGVRYVIRDYRSGGSKRAIPTDFGDAEQYDARRYVRLLAEACASVLEQFDVSCTAEYLELRNQHR